MGRDHVLIWIDWALDFGFGDVAAAVEDAPVDVQLIGDVKRLIPINIESEVGLLGIRVDFDGVICINKLVKLVLIRSQLLDKH